MTPHTGLVAAPPIIRPPIRIATWNVQGARILTRRKLIDAICHQHSIDILCLQDGRFFNASYSTDHYEWLPSSAPAKVCPKFGCFLLLRKKGEFQHHQFTVGVRNEESFVICVVKRHDQIFIVVNAYLPCNGQPEATESYDLLDTILSKLHRLYPKLPLIVCGDFNAHLGTDLQSCPEMDGLIGPHLLHTETNENGEMLAGITLVHRLGTATSMISSSALVTRTHGSTQSQLDHILIHENMIQQVLNVYGQWQPFSDHKLIVMDLTPSPSGMRNIALFEQ